MENNLFNKNYNKYWKKRVSSSSDGSKVPTPSVFGQLIKEMDIKKNDKVLDLGCGDGRNFNEISKYSNLVYGIDIDISMIEDAANYNYQSLHSAKAENTNFPSNYLDKILALGVFDVVEQEKGLIELNRILKVGGVCGFTGKNADYLDDDELAFVAERNAKLKDFPNHFTDLKKLIDEIKQYGFFIEKLFICKKRGDFGKEKIIQVNPYEYQQFYEYFIILKKDSSIENFPEIRFAYEFSKTAIKKYKNSNEKDILVFFKKNKNEIK
jgi:ubiquinone/menaquinone biosynthesis C-methylase UbiE